MHVKFTRVNKVVSEVQLLRLRLISVAQWLEHPTSVRNQFLSPPDSDYFFILCSYQILKSFVNRPLQTGTRSCVEPRTMANLANSNAFLRWSALYVVHIGLFTSWSDVWYEHLNRTRSGSKKYRLSFIRSSVVVLMLCKSGADPGFFLGGGAPLTDWWRKKN